MQFYPKLQKYINYQILPQLKQLPTERKTILDSLVKAIIDGSQMSYTVDIVFICTHNSRRSHFGQIWIEIAARYYQLEGLRAYSGGTEVTAFEPRAIEAIERAGCIVNTKIEEVNPHYMVSFSLGFSKITCFSKLYDDACNPKRDFVAILVCDQADKNCPNIAGAHRRVAVVYKDPKIADDTPEETQAYTTCCLKMATEMFYVIERIKDILDEED